MEPLSLTVLLLISLPEAILVVTLGLALVGIRPTLKQILLIGFIEAILGDLIRTLPFPFGVHTILQLITSSLVAYFIMRIQYRISLLAILLGVTVYGIVEGISASFLFAITGISFNDVFNNHLLRLAFFIPEAVLLILIILALRHFEGKLLRYREFIAGLGSSRSLKTNRTFLLLSLFLIQNLLAIILSFFSFTADANNYLLMGNTVYSHWLRMLLVVLLIGAMLAALKRVISLISDEIQARAEVESLRRVEDLVNVVRIQRHDFGNHLQAAYGLLEVGAYEEAKAYIAGSVAEIEVNLDLVRIDNLAVAALLYSKTAQAQAKNICLEIKVETTFADLPLASRDVNAILGNLIDNAIESVADLPADQKHVKLVLARNADSYVFEVGNTASNTHLELAKDIFAPGFSTKGKDRGLGLYSVKKTVEKYRGLVQVTNAGNETVFKVSLPCKANSDYNPNVKVDNKRYVNLISRFIPKRDFSK